MNGTTYRIIIMAQADQALHHIVLYRVFDDKKEMRIYNIFSQRQDYLQLLQGL